MVAGRSGRKSSRRKPLPTDPERFNLGDPQTYQMVRNIFFRRFSRRVVDSGMDPEDTLQSIFVGLLTRSQGRSRWDPTRGAMSTWVYVAMNGMIVNMADSHYRAQRRGAPGWTEDVALMQMAG